MRKYNVEKNKTNIGMYILVGLLIIVGYFITIIDSKAVEPMDSDMLVPVISDYDIKHNQINIQMSDNNTINIIMDENETVDDYMIVYYIGDARFIKFTNKFFDFLINSDDDRLYQYYYHLKDISYQVN